MTSDMKYSKTSQYLKETELDRHQLGASNKLRLSEPSPFKTYPEVETIELPKATWRLHEARIVPLMQQRRSLRKFSDQGVTIDELSFLLWCSQGFTARLGKRFLRTTPSAGALYPIETYLTIQNVTSLAAGLYHFNPVSFELERILNEDIGSVCAEAFLNQAFMRRAAVNFIWTAVAARSLSKYGDRGGRYIFLDAAHICQNILLAAEAVNCGGCPLAAFYDKEVNEMLGVDGIEEMAIYAASVGKKP